MAQAVQDLHEQGSPAFDAAIPMLSQLLKAEMAEREVRSVAYHMKAARFPAYRDLSGFDFAASEIREALVRQLHRCEFMDAAENVVLIRWLAGECVAIAEKRRPWHGKIAGIDSDAGSDAKGKSKEFRLRRRDRGSDPVPGMPGAGS